MSLTLRMILVFVSIVALATPIYSNGNNREAMTVGVTRWDAWYHVPGDPVMQAVEDTLSPVHWQHLAPFFTEILPDNTVQYTMGYKHQSTIDQEIELAHNAGLDYFAFVYYKEAFQSNLSCALQHYLSSTKNNLINYCLIISGSHHGHDWETTFAEYVEHFKKSQYQRVGQRPLLYVYDPIGFEQNFSRQEIRQMFKRLRQMTRAAGLPKPYVVIMDWWPDSAKEWKALSRADAISIYVYPDGLLPGGPDGEEHPYSEQVDIAHSYIDRARQLDLPIIPAIAAGWDPRPRVENPVPWYDGYSGTYFTAPKPGELENHLRDILRWVRVNPKHAQARHALIPSWNEFDEGHAICPTLNVNKPQSDTTLLDAVKAVLKP